MNGMIKKSIYSTIGYFSILLGLIGLFLPLMPTTCFLILAVWAFSRSNPIMCEKIKQHPRFGPTVRNWINHKTISRKTKCTISVSIIAAFSLSIFIFKSSVIISTLLFSGMIILLLYINTRNERLSSKATDTDMVAEDLQIF